jgi:hypothetical protein
VFVLRVLLLMLGDDEMVQVYGGGVVNVIAGESKQRRN